MMKVAELNDMTLEGAMKDYKHTGRHFLCEDGKVKFAGIEDESLFSKEAI